MARGIFGFVQICRNLPGEKIFHFLSGNFGISISRTKSRSEMAKKPYFLKFGKNHSVIDIWTAKFSSLKPRDKNQADCRSESGGRADNQLRRLRRRAGAQKEPWDSRYTAM